MVASTATSAGAIILREVEGKLKIALAQHQRTDKTWVYRKVMSKKANQSKKPLYARSTKRQD